MKEKYFLILHTAFIGDLCMVIPLMKRLRYLEPSAKLFLVCRKGLGSFFLQMNLVDQVYEMIKKDRKSYKKVFNQIEEISFEKIFCLHESIRSAFFVRKLKAKRKIGFKKWWNFFIFDERIPDKNRFPEPLRYMSFLFSWDLEIKKLVYEFFNKKYTFFLKICKIWSSKKGNFFSAETEKERRIKSHFREGLFCWPEENFIPLWSSLSLKKKLLLKRKDLGVTQKKKVKRERKKKRIFLAPRDGLSTKCWHWSGFSKIGRRLSLEGWEILLVGTQKERGYLNKISRFIPDAENLAGKTSLSELLNLFSTGQALIGNDSGAVHMAAAVELPTVVILGPAGLDFRFPPWQNNLRIVKKNFRCSPCFNQRSWRTGSPKVCPLNTHHCMTEIHPDSVYLALKDLLLKSSSFMKF